MERITLSLRNCYGIKRLEKSLDFSRTRAFALYAPNGVMKSSLANTFQDAAEGQVSKDRIFPSRQTIRDITDEHGKPIQGSRVLVVQPYDEHLRVTERTSTLLLDAELKEDYDNMLRDAAAARDSLLAAVRQQSGSKRNMEAEISSAVMTTPTELDAALVRLRREVKDQPDAPFSELSYDTIFNEKVLAALATKNLSNAIHEYARRYNELLAASKYFRKGTFDYYNAAQVAKSLKMNGFFSAKHTVTLNADTEKQEIADSAEIETLISDEKDALLADSSLRRSFDDVARQLVRNTQLRDFYNYVVDDEAILSRLNNPEKLREDAIKSYLKVHEDLYEIWLSKYDAARDRLREIEEIARKQITLWESTIDIFNDRFFVPFVLEAKNKAEVMLGRTGIIELGFKYVDGKESTELSQNDLLQSLSMGERKALYILNVIFEIETRRKTGQETLIIVDDLADSFDYRNKYAIIEYLKEISQSDLFRLIIMTHNFDFFRTIESRFIGYKYCLMASRNQGRVTLARASGIRNVFARDWKLHFFDDPKKKIACIPFLRNLVEMTTGESDPRYDRLTMMLHWKVGSDLISVGNLDEIYESLCNESGQSVNADQKVHELMVEQADACLTADTSVNLENKIVLAIATRLAAERFMIGKLEECDAALEFDTNQGRGLTDAFKIRFPNEDTSISTLERVSLMTPENIHVNSFMYEPIIDMSDDHLRKLYKEVSSLEH